MSRNSPGVFLGTTPNGETQKFLNGGVSNGPAILPALTSWVRLVGSHLTGPPKLMPLAPALGHQPQKDLVKTLTEPPEHCGWA